MKIFSKYWFELMKYEAQNLILQTQMALRVMSGKKFDGSRRDYNVGKDFVLAFEDDFDSLDLSKWQTYSYNGYRYSIDCIEKNHEAPTQYADDSCVKTKDSILYLCTEYNPKEIHHVSYDGTDYGKYIIPFRYGEVESFRTFNQKEGYFEIRCKQPNSLNMWTAFWLCSIDKWPPEIDIFEVFTNDKFKIATTTVHWTEKDKHDCKGRRYKTPDLSKDFHVWGCEWDSKTIKIFFDGFLVGITPTPPNFDYKMQIIINTGVNNKNDINKTTTPNYMEIDYVRAYKKI